MYFGGIDLIKVIVSSFAAVSSHGIQIRVAIISLLDI
jgi:hypothetical protein